jgi:hypothetical protein
MAIGPKHTVPSVHALIHDFARSVSFLPLPKGLLRKSREHTKFGKEWIPKLSSEINPQCTCESNNEGGREAEKKCFEKF